jgi:hypothetical protein
MDLEQLKSHIDEKFQHHEAMDRMRHSGIDRLIEGHAEALKDNKDAILMAHARVDEITTQIKTVKGLGFGIASAATVIMGWLGLSK